MRHSLSATVACLLMLTINGTAQAVSASNNEIQANGVPSGFGELERDRDLLIDVYFGQQRVGDALATLRDGRLIFKDPGKVIDLVRQAVRTLELEAALSQPLAVNADRVCSTVAKESGCGTMSPSVVSIIYDEQRFRVDLFISPRLLRIVSSEASGFLPPPNAPLSLTSAIGVAAAGSFGAKGSYNIQNRTIVAFNNARLRTSNAFASGIGWVVDDFVAEVDRKAMRYSAGLFWTPGDEFFGQRRILGAGFGTQLDTAIDREALAGTPLILFLARPAQVEIFIDGRLISSRSYSAGNSEIDTSAVGEGSFMLTLRIREDGAPVREEKRFFTKNARVAALGHPIFFGVAGVLANTRRDRPVSVSRQLYVQSGGAVRLNPKLAIDVSAIGTSDKVVAEVGAWLLTRPGRVRAAGLVSSRGDHGVLMQLAANPNSKLNIYLDFRRLWSRDGQPLVPLSTYVDTFDAARPTPSQTTSGSYVQAVGSAGLRVGEGTISLVGAYRRDRAGRADYSIGPSIYWPVATRRDVQIMFQASAQRTRTSFAASAGLRVFMNRGPLAVAATVGQSMEDDRSTDMRDRTTGSLNAQYSRTAADGTNISGELGAERDLYSSSVRAAATYVGALGTGRVDVQQHLEGSRRTLYGANFQSGFALAPGAVTFGARHAEQSAIIVSLEGETDGGKFRVLVDDAERGIVRAGDRLSIFVPAYRRYRVRLAPVGAPPVDIDTSARDVTLYPGNAQLLRWHAARVTTLFAQAVGSDGNAIAQARVDSDHDVSETDENGYFQIEVREGDRLRVDKAGMSACKITVPSLSGRGELLSAGKMSCR